MLVGDPKESSLKFMYSQPTSEHPEENSAKKEAPRPVFHDSTEDDDAVKAFKELLKKKRSSSDASSSSVVDTSTSQHSHVSSGLTLEEEEKQMRIKKLENDPNFAASATQSKLEKELGRRHNPGLTQFGKSIQLLYNINLSKEFIV